MANDKRKSHHLLAGLLVVLVLAFLALWYVESTTQHPSPTPVTTATPTKPALVLPDGYTSDPTYQQPSTLALRHTKSKHDHIYSGALVASPCDTFSSSVSTQGGPPAHITLGLVILRPVGTCVDGPATSTPFSFSVSAAGSSATNPVFDAVTINGEPVTITTTDR